MNDTKILLEQKAATLASKAEATEELQSEVASLRVRLDAVNQVHHHHTHSRSHTLTHTLTLTHTHTHTHSHTHCCAICSQEKEMDNARMEELVGDNARLELENKSK